MELTSGPHDLAELLLRPTDPTWDVIADELQARGDPIGSLIALERAALAGEAWATGDAIRAARAPREASFEALAARQLADSGLELLACEWRFGHVFSLELSTDYRDFDAGGLDALLAADETSGLASLSVTLHAGELDDLLTTIERRRPPLRSLSVSHFQTEGRGSATVLRALPRLRQLSLIGASLDAFDHPELQHLELWGPPAPLAKGSGLPRLRRFMVGAGWDGHALGQMVDFRALPELRQLLVWEQFDRRSPAQAWVVPLLRTLADTSGPDLDRLELLSIAGLWGLDANQRETWLPALAQIPRVIGVGCRFGDSERADERIEACRALIPGFEAPPLSEVTLGERWAPAHSFEHEHRQAIEQVTLSWPGCFEQPLRAWVQWLEMRAIARRWDQLEAREQDTARALFELWAKLRVDSSARLSTARLHALFDALAGRDSGLRPTRDVLARHLECCEHTTFSLRSP